MMRHDILSGLRPLTRECVIVNAYIDLIQLDFVDSGSVCTSAVGDLLCFNFCFCGIHDTILVLKPATSLSKDRFKHYVIMTRIMKISYFTTTNYKNRNE